MTRKIFNVFFLLFLLVGAKTYAAGTVTPNAVSQRPDEAQHPAYRVDSCAIDFSVLADPDFDVEDNLTVESDHDIPQRTAQKCCDFSQVFHELLAGIAPPKTNFDVRPEPGQHLPIYLSNRVLRI